MVESRLYFKNTPLTISHSTFIITRQKNVHSIFHISISRVLWALYFLFAEKLPSVNDVNVYHLRSPTSNSLTSLLSFLSPFPFYVVLVFMVVIGISVAFFDTFYCVVAWEAITNVAVVDSKRTLDLYLLKVRVSYLLHFISSKSVIGLL